MRLFIMIFFCLTISLPVAALAAEENSGFGALFAHEKIAALEDQDKSAIDEDALLAAAAAFAAIAPAAGDAVEDNILHGEEAAGAAHYTPLPDSLADQFIGP